MANIESLSISGFKSIRELKEFRPNAGVNIFIGANGAGKTNLISFFRMLSWMVNSVDKFQIYVAENGFASAFLHDGPRVTKEIFWSVSLRAPQGVNEYSARLVYGAQDSIFFAEEKVRFSSSQIETRNPNWTEFPAPHRESQLRSFVPEFPNARTTVRTITHMLSLIKVHQFHNTSLDAPIRNSWPISDGRHLKESAGNLGAFLYKIQTEYPQEYRRIVLLVRKMVPFFDDFVLEPQGKYIILRWRENNSEKVFDASLASDGMLRYIALVALLAQPHHNLPSVMFIDEPELGLHPSAIELIAGLIKTTSRHCQMFVSTQSPALVDMFEPEQVTVVERIGRASTYTKLDSEALKTWMEEYSLSEMWEKNIIKGLP
jgi:predicted ATPase